MGSQLNTSVPTRLSAAKNTTAGMLLALLARDAATEVTQLEYLLAQPIAPIAKLKLHIAGIIRAYHQFPYMNRLIHYLLHESSAEAADEVSKFFVAPLLDFHRRS